MNGTCDVVLTDYDGDMASVYHEHIVRARTPHTCGECGGTIPAGDRYERISGLWYAGAAGEEEWSVYRHCLPCSEVSREFSDSRCFGNLWDGMEEQWDEGAHITACLNRLTTAAAKKRLHAQWLRWKALDRL